jgi:hypothetical protein
MRFPVCCITKTNKKIEIMKTLIENININSKKAQEIKINNDEAGTEYLVWSDHSEITAKEIESLFRITKYNNGSVNLEHKQDNFRIEDIIF